MLIAIDPGKDKCGLAVLNKAGQVIDQKVVERQKILTVLPLYLEKYKAKKLIIGQGKFGRDLANESRKLEQQFETHLVSEKNSTLEARKLYWQNNRPAGFWKLVPASLRLIRRPIDDYAAIIIGRRYLGSL